MKAPSGMALPLVATQTAGPPAVRAALFGASMIQLPAAPLKLNVQKMLTKFASFDLPASANTNKVDWE